MADKKFWSIDISSMDYKILKNPSEGDNFYAPGDICEKVPYIPEELMDGGYIYPLGGNTRGYKLRDYLRLGNIPVEEGADLDFYDDGVVDEHGNPDFYKAVNPLCRKSPYLDVSPYLYSYLKSGYKYKVGSNWMGCFSVTSTNDCPKNGNLYNFNSGDFTGYTNTNPIDLNKSVLNSAHDRIHLEGSSVVFNHTFDNLESNNYYCFSCYAKSTLPGIVYRKLIVNDSDTELFASDDIVSENFKGFELKDTYIRIVIRKKITSSTLNIKFTLGDGNTSTDMDICGICLSKGPYPFDIDYREGIIQSPLNFFPKPDNGDSVIELNKNWTVKYKRLVLGIETDTEKYNDWICGRNLPYPQYPGEWELVTLVHKSTGESTYTVRSKKGKKVVDLGDNLDIESIGGRRATIILGGYLNGSSFVATPGIYKDLLVFNTNLTDNQSDEIDSSIFSVSFVDGLSLMRSSLFRESLT